MQMDGNCFFRAISSAIDETQENHLQWRQRICQEMKDHPHRLVQYTDQDVSLEQHVVQMKKPGKWADTVVMYAAAQLLKKDLYVLSPQPNAESDGSKYRWLKVPTLSAFGGGDKSYITICHTHGNHFDLITPSDHEVELPPPSFGAAAQMNEKPIEV